MGRIGSYLIVVRYDSYGEVRGRDFECKRRAISCLENGFNAANRQRPKLRLFGRSRYLLGVGRRIRSCACIHARVSAHVTKCHVTKYYILKGLTSYFVLRYMNTWDVVRIQLVYNMRLDICSSTCKFI
jgi:hypothetical protein